MSIKVALHLGVLVGCLLVAAYSGEAKVETFWAGRTLHGLKELPVKSAWTKGKDGRPYHLRLKDGFMLAGLRPTPVHGVLVRGERCYLFDLGEWPDALKELPVRQGDQFFHYHDRAELEAFKLRILEKDEAAMALLQWEAEHGSGSGK